MEIIEVTEVVMKKFISMLLLALLCFTIVAPKITYAATVKLNKTSITLDVGDTYLLKLSGIKGTINWTSSDKKIATVSSKGKITAVAKGSATIIATINKKQYKCNVKVKDPEVTVTVTNMFNNDEVQAFLSSINFINVVENEDFTTTYTMTKSQQLSILKFLNVFIKELLNNRDLSELPEYYKSIVINENMTSFDVYVDKNGYIENSAEDYSFIIFIILSGGYQQFAGVTDDNITYIIHYIDADTKEEIESIDSSDF